MIQPGFSWDQEGVVHPLKYLLGIFVIACGESEADRESCAPPNACGGNTTGGAGGSGAGSGGAGGTSSCSAGGYGDFRVEFADRYCKIVAGCCQALGTATDLEACKAQMGLVPVAECKSLAGGSAYFDSTAASACLDELASYYASCSPVEFLSLIGLVDKPVICYSVVHGLANPGEPCASSSDCKPPPGGIAICGSGPSTPICYQRFAPALGMKCSETICELDSELYCDTNMQLCKARPGQAEACGNGSLCAGDLVCIAGLCGPRAEVGAACDDHDDCVPNAYCDSEKCVPRAGIGGDCVLSAGCVKEAHCLSGTCVADQSICDFCMWDDECKSECAPQPGSGGGAAVSGKCASPHPFGMECFPAAGC